MSRKDYVKLAVIIRARIDGGTPAQVKFAHELAHELAPILKSDNTNFRSDRFFQACGLDSEGHLR